MSVCNKNYTFVENKGIEVYNYKMNNYINCYYGQRQIKVFNRLLFD